MVTVMMKTKETDKRNIFAELMQGLGAMQQHRKGKLTLRTHSLPLAAGKLQNSQCATLSLTSE